MTVCLSISSCPPDFDSKGATMQPQTSCRDNIVAMVCFRSEVLGSAKKRISNLEAPIHCFAFAHGVLHHLLEKATA